MPDAFRHLAGETKVMAVPLHVRLFEGQIQLVSGPHTIILQVPCCTTTPAQRRDQLLTAMVSLEWRAGMPAGSL